MPSVFPTRCWCRINFCGYNSQVQNPWDHTSFQFQCQHCQCLLSKILKWPNFKGHLTYLLPSVVFKGKFKRLEVPLPISQRKVIQKKNKITTQPLQAVCNPQVQAHWQRTTRWFNSHTTGFELRTFLVIPKPQNGLYQQTHHS